MKSLESKITVITGGASGIGRMLALQMASQGSRVVVWDINQELLSSLEREAAEKKVSIIGMALDITDRKRVYACAQEVLSRVGPVDILVNNAGVVSGQTLLETPDEKIEKTIQVNFLSNCWTVKAFLPSMIERNTGHIVTIASAAALIGVTGLADYSASKSAVYGFHESVRMELKKQRKKIATTVVCPFFIDTGMFAGVQTRFPLLLPILRPEYAVRRINKAIIAKKERLILPRFVYSVFLLKLFPVWLMDVIADFFGITHAMDQFTGRRG